MKWHVPDENDETVLLSPGDTCVHDAYRQKGLSLSMGRFAMEEFAPEYPLFLNLSASKQALPGYLRLGFEPLVPKINWTRVDLFGLMRSHLSNQRDDQISGIRSYDNLGTVLISETPRPAEMLAVHSSGDVHGDKFTIRKDEAFFRWRFSNQRNKYLFYYLRENGDIRGYVVLGLSEGGRRGHILDYGPENPSAVASIVGHIIKTKKYQVLGITDLCLSKDLLCTLSDLGFKANSPLRTIKRRFRGEKPLPVLVRPVKGYCAEADWFMSGRDVRSAHSWDIKPICSDAA
jgi:hypothetical protein